MRGLLSWIVTRKFLNVQHRVVLLESIYPREATILVCRLKLRGSVVLMGGLSGTGNEDTVQRCSWDGLCRGTCTKQMPNIQPPSFTTLVLQEGRLVVLEMQAFDPRA